MFHNLMKSALLGMVLSALILPLSAEHPGSFWMKSLPDSTRLTALNIPGTHDSGARFEPIPGTAKCQTLTIPEQLQAGVRFLDIRCRHVRDAFLIHHGPISQNLSFDQVLADLYAFLKAHPDECVILSIKEEFTPSNNTRSFEQTFDCYVAKNSTPWWLGSNLPILKQARGKILLFRRFHTNADEKGIAASPWKDNATFSIGSLKIQDVYLAQDAAIKWQHFQQLAQESARSKTDTLYLNFASATGSRLGLPAISSVAQPMNQRLTDYYKAESHHQRGIILVDFATPALCESIYRAGLPANPP